MTGRIKHYSAKEGYGFIYSDYGDIFFHYSDTNNRNCLREGYQVTFNLCATGKGLQARQVKVI